MNFDAMMHIFCVRKNISRLINKMMIKMNVLSASDFFFLNLETVYSPIQYDPNKPLIQFVYIQSFKIRLAFSISYFEGKKLICYSSLMKYEYFIQSQDISF